MNDFDLFRTAAAGMDAERAALDVAARNVGAAQADGPAFTRLLPRFAFGPQADDVGAASDDPDDAVPDGGEDLDGEPAPAVRYLGTTPERGAERDATSEMVAVLDAQRAYEADAGVFDIAKQLAERTIDVGLLQ